ncbi:hypothetical protein U1Q18_017477 [Sarracenia purpurea var. burkii]
MTCDKIQQVTVLSQVCAVFIRRYWHTVQHCFRYLKEEEAVFHSLYALSIGEEVHQGSSECDDSEEEDPAQIVCRVPTLPPLAHAPRPLFSAHGVSPNPPNPNRIFRVRVYATASHSLVFSLSQSHSLSLQLRDLYFRRRPSTRRRLSVAPHAKQWDDDDGGDGDMEAIVRGESDYDNPPSSAGGKRKVLKDRSGSSRKREKKSERRERHGSDKAGSKFKMKKSGYSGGQSRDHNDHNGDAEVKEMWDTIAGGDSGVLLLQF